MEKEILTSILDLIEEVIDNMQIADYDTKPYYKLRKVRELVEEINK